MAQDEVGPLDGDRVLFAPRKPPRLGPDAGADVARYAAWSARRERQRLAGAGGSGGAGPAGPDITFLVVVGPAEGAALGGCLRSLRRQTSAAWRLALAAAPGAFAGRGPRLLARLRGRANATWLPWSEGGTDGAARATAELLDRAATDAVCVLGPHDELAPDAVALLSAALASADVAYGDEDRLDRTGRPYEPALKPAFSPDLLLATCYLGRPVAARRTAVAEAGGVRAVPGGEWEHDLLLRLTERADRVVHVAEVLCHRRDPEPRPETGQEASAPGRSAPASAAPGGPTRPMADQGGAVVAMALARRGQEGTVVPGPLPGTFRVRRRPARMPSVSAIVPFRDGARFLRTCVDSVTATAGGVDLELVLVDNGSSEPETLSLVERLAARPGVVVRRDPRPFNWATLNNAAATTARGDVLVFLNNDVEAGSTGWLTALAAQALRPDIGAAGARLLYPGGRLQHAGMVVGLGGAAGHVLAGLPAEEPGYLGMAVLARECSAVTGACLATRRAVFEALGGFDEELGLDLNDVDYCLRAGQQGWRVVYEPAAELVHHESPSRGTSGSAADIRRFLDRWRGALTAGDPYLHPALTRVDSSCALGGPDEQGWWQRWRATLPER